MFWFIIPYRIGRRLRGVPFVTIALIAINVVVFFATWPTLPSVVKHFGFTANAQGLLTWFTSMFLHASLDHVGFNMLFLWLFGGIVEDSIGPLRYTLLYFAGGLVAALTHAGMMALFVPDALKVPAIGASGAVAAVMGLCAVRMYKAEMHMFWFVWVFWFIRFGRFALPSLVGFGLWFARELISGLIGVTAGVQGGVANWAHIGGLAFGVVAGLWLGFVKDADVEYLSEEARQYASAGSGQVAAEKFKELEQKQPGNPDWHLERARSLVAARGDEKEAAEELAKAVELMMGCGRQDEALIAYKDLAPALQQAHLSSRMLLSVGSLAETRGDLETACKAYYELCWNRPEAREAEKALFRLAHVYLAEGRREEANTVWDVFNAQYPGSDWLTFANPWFKRDAAS